MNTTSLDGSSGSELSVESSNVIACGQWRVLGRIGEGSFGEVFEGTVLPYTKYLRN
jgi:hypothetical protein